MSEANGSGRRITGRESGGRSIGTAPEALVAPVLAEDLGVGEVDLTEVVARCCLLYTSPSPRDATLSRMPSSA